MAYKIASPFGVYKRLKLGGAVTLSVGLIWCVWLLVQRHPTTFIKNEAGPPMPLNALTSPTRIAVGVTTPASVTLPPNQIKTGAHEFVVEPTNFVSSLSVVGTIIPGQSVAVLAPFDGIVKQENFTYGQSVRRGDILLTMDQADIDHQKRAAEIAYVKAKQTEQILDNWSSSPDVLRAARTKKSAEGALKATERKITETAALWDKGLVARSEYEDLLQQKNDRALELAAAQSDYDAALAKGGEAERLIARLALADAHADIIQKENENNGAVIRAAVDGVLSRPPSGKTDGGSGDVFAGVRLTAGQIIGVIARGDKLGVLFHLSEEDANRVHEGQAVLVIGSGFPGMTIGGHVVRVAAESSASTQQMSFFEGMASLDELSASDRSRVRLGMSADVKVLLRDSEGAIVVPPQAIIGAGSDAEVDVKQPGKNDVRRVKVGIGDVTPTGVEVRSGLHPGDVVIWHVSPQIAPRQ